MPRHKAPDNPAANTRRRSRARPALARTKRQKVQEVVRYLRETHFWTVKDFVEAYVTAEKEEGDELQGKTPEWRTDELIRALESENVVHQLYKAMKKRGEWILLPALAAELDALTAQKAYSTWSPDHEHMAVDLQSMYSELQEDSQIKLILKGITHKDTKDYNVDQRRKCVFLAAFLARHRSPKKANRLHTLLALYMQGQGTRRRAISVLHGMGICGSPHKVYRCNALLQELEKERLKTVGKMRNIASLYDNFVVSDKVKEAGIGHVTHQQNLTTVKAFVVPGIPAEGIPVQEWDRTCLLQQEAILESPGLVDTEVCRKISAAIIFTELKRTFGEQVATVQGKATVAAPWLPPEMPAQINGRGCVAPERTQHFTGEVIYEDEGSISGTHGVLDQLFVHQYGWTAQDPGADHIHMVHGDQHTVSNLRSALKELRENDDKFEQLQHILPVPGLFHFQMALVQLIYNTYSSAANSQGWSSLNHHRHVLNRQQCPSFETNFDHQERLILDSFRARICGFAYQWMQDRGTKCDELTAVHECIAALSIQELHQLQEYILDTAFSTEARRFRSPLSTGRSESQGNTEPKPVLLRDAIIGDAVTAQLYGLSESDCKKRMRADSKKKTPTIPEFVPDGDEEQRTHIRFMHATETYWALKHAIRTGHTGLLTWAVDRCVVLFSARSSKNYAFISKWYKWLTDTPACSERLQSAILRSSLFNTSGRRTAFYPTDLAIEFLNRDLSTICLSRTGHQSAFKACRTAALTAGPRTDLRNTLERAFGEETRTKHTSPKYQQEMHWCALHTAESTQDTSLLSFQQHRSQRFYGTDLFALGVTRLQSQGLQTFNIAVFNDEDHITVQDTAEPDANDGIDVLPDVEQYEAQQLRSKEDNDAGAWDEPQYDWTNVDDV